MFRPWLPSLPSVTMSPWPRSCSSETRRSASSSTRWPKAQRDGGRRHWSPARPASARRAWCARWPSASAPTRGAVQALAAGTGRDADAVHALTRGNPFFVTETLAAPREDVPASVKDAVLARLRGLDADCREALERLSVVPSHVPPELVTVLLAEHVNALPAAELAGVIEGRVDGLGFRHELARRAIESSLPVTRRRAL